MEKNDCSKYDSITYRLSKWWILGATVLIITGFVFFTLISTAAAAAVSICRQTTDTPGEKMLDLYSEANRLYNIGEYQQAIDICRRIVKAYEVYSISKLPDESPLELAHTLMANCYAALKDTDLAVTELRKIIQFSESSRMPDSAGKRARLKIGGIYRRANQFQQALDQYKELMDKYSNSVYSEYAKEKSREIQSLQRGIVKGRVYLKQKQEHGDITLVIFNGFSTSSNITSVDGSFEAPIFESSGGTFISVFALKDGYLPQVKNISIPNQYELSMDTLTLLPMQTQKKGVLVGVCFRTIRGGKLTSRQGINSFRSECKISLKSAKELLTTQSNSEGVFLVSLTRGDYELTVTDFNIKEFVTISAGHTTIQNINLGEIKID